MSSSGAAADAMAGAGGRGGDAGGAARGGGRGRRGHGWVGDRRRDGRTRGWLGTGGTGGGGTGGASTGAAGTGGRAGTGGAGTAGSGVAGSGGRGGQGAAACVPHDINLQTVSVTGTFTVRGMSTSGWSGAPTWTSAPRRVTRRCSGRRRRDRTQLVLPGTYDLYYKAQVAAPGLPANTLAKLDSGIVLPAGAAATLDVDIPATTVLGAITVNGAMVPVTTGKSGRLPTPGGDDVYLGNTMALTPYSTLVVPGTYDVYYAGESLERRAVQRGGQAADRSCRRVEPAGARHRRSGHGGVRKGHGERRGAADGQRVCARVHAKHGGDCALLATVGPAAATTRREVPGTYDIYYEWTRSTATTGVPSNLNALLRSGVVVGSTAVALNVDIPPRWSPGPSP